MVFVVYVLASGVSKRISNDGIKDAELSTCISLMPHVRNSM